MLLDFSICTTETCAALGHIYKLWPELHLLPTHSTDEENKESSDKEKQSIDEGEQSTDKEKHCTGEGKDFADKASLSTDKGLETK